MEHTQTSVLRRLYTVLNVPRSADNADMHIRTSNICTHMCTVHTAVLELRSKQWMDNCPSIIILAQTIPALFGHISKHACATVDVPQ